MLPRYFPYAAFLDALKKCVDHISNVEVTLLELGQSVNGATIYGIKLGAGSHKVLAWSNMHGNETTTTRALLEFLKMGDLSAHLKNITLYIIPVLNPDGLDAWTRFNANNIDLNRDAIGLTQPESRVLRKVFEDFKPHYCFNLHDQRTIYGDTNGEQAVQLSFLAPAASEDRAVTAARLKAMAVISRIQTVIEPHCTGIIGRYSDAFNINCVGDYFQSLQVPTVLFEAGHAGEDYYRDEAVQLIVASFIEALSCVSTESSLDDERTLQEYLSIPAIAQNFADILIKDMAYGNLKMDIAIQYHETLLDDTLYFVPILVGINSDEIKNAHYVIQMDDNTNQPADFSISGDLVVTCPSLGMLTFH